MVHRTVTLAAAGFVISGKYGDPFEHGGFAGAVLADDDGDRPIEAEFEFVLQKRKAKRIGLAVGDARWVEPDAPEIWRRQVDGAISS
jgi:hypothetical protein